MKNKRVSSYMVLAVVIVAVVALFAGSAYTKRDFTPSQQRQKQERIETGLDYFGARYYASVQGRFISTDSGPFTIADPQNFNRYTYVQNNPLKFIDPTGRTLTLTGNDADNLVEELEAKTGYDLTRDAKTGRVTISKGTKRNKHGTSKHLAGLVKQIIGDKKIDVNIEVQENIVHENNRGVMLDVGYDPKEFDFADYRQWNSADSKLGAIAIAHALDESYEYKKLNAAGFGATMDMDGLAHIRATYFESRVLSDLTGVREQARVDKATEKISHFEYTSVGYDILWKTTTPTEAFPGAVNRVVVRNYKNLLKTFKR
jgi:RHS repeat-associated protein